MILRDPEKSIAVLPFENLSEDKANAYFTPAFLRLEPRWDPLRGDPVFQKLCEEKKP